jgi:hypothetical protein
MILSYMARSIISLKPKDGFVITNTEKAAIVDDIIATQAVVAITSEIVDPRVCVYHAGREILL